MAASRRHNLVPVLPALGLAAAAVGAVAHGALASPPSVNAQLATHAMGDDNEPVGASLRGDDGDHAITPASGDDDGHASPHPKTGGTRHHRVPLHRPRRGPAPTTSTTAVGLADPSTTSTTDPPTTTTIPPTTSTVAPATTTSTTAAPPVSPLTVNEKFTQLVNGKPMLVQLTVDNTAAAAQTITMTVDIQGTALGHYLNVNNDSTQTNPANWSCTPNEVHTPGADNVFTCTATIPASTSNVVMATTGSNLAAAAHGTTVTVTSTITADTPAGAPFPAPVAVTGTVA